MTQWKPALLYLKPFGREFDKDIAVESRTGSQSYRVNLYRYTCSCPDFIERRSAHPVGDTGRSCKHLRDTVLGISAADPEVFGDELTRVIFKSSYGPYDRIWFAPGPDDDVIALGVNEGKSWVNIFARSGPDTPYTRYGYHLSDKRWAFDSLPANSRFIEEMLNTVPDLRSGVV